MAPFHTEVACRWTLTVLCFSLVVLSSDESSPGEGFVSPQGLPSSLSPFFLSQSSPPAPVAPMALGFVVGSNAGGEDWGALLQH